VTKVYLIRNGETSYNRDNVGLGRADIPLTEMGRRQSMLAVDYLKTIKFTAIYTSPARRAGYLADLLAQQGDLVPEYLSSLVEMDVGETEGMHLSDVAKRFPDFMKEWRSINQTRIPMPGGESLTDVQQRVNFIFSILKSYTDGNIAVVSHNFVLKILLCKLLNLEIASFNSIVLSLASISVIEMLPYPRISSLNETCYLEGTDTG